MKTLIGIGQLTCVVLLQGTVAANQQEADIAPRVEVERIITDAFVDATGQTLAAQRVYVWEFGEDPFDPFALGDPGFNARPDSGLPEGSRVGVQVLSDLSYWNASGPVSLAAVPNDETLQFAFLSQSRLAGTGTGILPEMFWGPAVGTNGTFHAHLNTILARPGGVGGQDPTPGIYLVELSVLSSDPGIKPSVPIFAIFNSGADDAAVDSAVDFVSRRLVPEPTTLTVCWLLAGGALLKRTRCGTMQG